MLLTACSSNVPWSHDAGLPYDAGAAPIWAFPRITADASRADNGQTTASDGPTSRAWRIRQSLPAIDDYSGDHRRFSFVRNPSDQPCIVYSNESGLYFGCLTNQVQGDTGRTSDASLRPDGQAIVTHQWTLERLSEQPNNSWDGSELDAIFDHQGNPWVVARQTPERRTLLYHHRDNDWHHEEVPFALGGIDPQLHLVGETIALVHAADEHHEAPATIASYRTPDGTWTHRRLIEAYDAQPGRWHRSLITDGQINFCSFEPASQRVTWGIATLDETPHTDAGPMHDATHSDAMVSELVRTQDFAGGPFCDVDNETLYYNHPLLGLITKQSDQGTTQTTSRKGPFTVIKTIEHELLLSSENGRLLIGRTDEEPFDLGVWTINDRPKALPMDDALLIATEATQIHELEFAFWEPAP